MRWMTLAHLHLDRVASAWLIQRFVDPDARIEYLDWDAERPGEEAGLTLFGMPGLELSTHDDDGTCFGKILRAYGLDEPALVLLESVVSAGVANALDLAPVRDLPDDLRCIGVALDLIGTGFGVMSDDAEHLARAIPLYDALYVLCSARSLPAEVQRETPRHPGARADFLRSALADTSTHSR